MAQKGISEAIIEAVFKSVFFSLPGAVGMGILVLILQMCAAFGSVIFDSCSSSLDDPIEIDKHGLTDFNFGMMCFCGYFLSLGFLLWFYLSRQELKIGEHDYEKLNLQPISIALTIVSFIVAIIIYPKILWCLLLGIPMLLLYIADKMK
jgi:hypothetical protein